MVFGKVTPGRGYIHERPSHRSLQTRLVLVFSQRLSSFAGKDPAVDPALAAYRFAAQYVLESSIRLVRGRAYISVQLIDGLTGRYLWAERFEAIHSRGIGTDGQNRGQNCLLLSQSLIFMTEDMRAKSKSPESFSAWGVSI